MLGSKLRAYIFFLNKSTRAHYPLIPWADKIPIVPSRAEALSLEPAGQAGSTAGLAALLPQAWKCEFRHHKPFSSSGTGQMAPDSESFTRKC